MKILTQNIRQDQFAVVGYVTYFESYMWAPGPLYLPDTYNSYTMNNITSFIIYS